MSNINVKQDRINYYSRPRKWFSSNGLVWEFCAIQMGQFDTYTYIHPTRVNRSLLTGMYHKLTAYEIPKY